MAKKVKVEFTQSDVNEMNIDQLIENFSYILTREVLVGIVKAKYPFAGNVDEGQVVQENVDHEYFDSIITEEVFDEGGSYTDSVSDATDDGDLSESNGTTDQKNEMDAGSENTVVGDLDATDTTGSVSMVREEVMKLIQYVKDPESKLGDYVDCVMTGSMSSRRHELVFNTGCLGNFAPPDFSMKPREYMEEQSSDLNQKQYDESLAELHGLCNTDFFDDITLGVGPSAYAVVSAEVRKAATEKKMDLLEEEITKHLQKIGFRKSPDCNFNSNYVVRVLMPEVLILYLMDTKRLKYAEAEHLYLNTMLGVSPEELCRRREQDSKDEEKAAAALDTEIMERSEQKRAKRLEKQQRDKERSAALDAQYEEDQESLEKFEDIPEFGSNNEGADLDEGWITDSAIDKYLDSDSDDDL